MPKQPTYAAAYASFSMTSQIRPTREGVAGAYERGIARAYAEAAAVKMETLYISFWKIGLDNLPLGDLTHRMLTAEEAASLIQRAEKRQCVAGEDIFAPYKQQESRQFF